MLAWLTLYRSSLQPTLTRYGTAAPTELEELLLGSYRPEQSGRETILNFDDAAPPTDLLATECSRFASAAFESRAGTTWTNKGGLSWAMIRYYYSAFYAAHALLRMWGWGCSYLDTHRANTVRDALALYSGNSNIALSRGQYRLVWSSDGSTITLSELGGGGLGGAHDGFWAVFVERLRQVQAATLTAPDSHEAQEAFLFLNSIERAVVVNKNTAALSQIRNFIQYRQGLNVWYPSGLGERESKQILELSRRWRASLSQVEIDLTSDLRRLVSASNALVALTRHLICVIAQHHDKLSPIARGPKRFLSENRLIVDLEEAPRRTKR